MKKLSLSLSTLVFAFTLLGPSVHASNYPADYCRQYVHIESSESFIIAAVSGGCNSSGDFVIGYKPTGSLSARNPDQIEALVLGHCEWGDNSRSEKITKIILGREWHGKGYLSETFSPDFAPQGCREEFSSFELFFSDGAGNWDSNYGHNYPLNPRGLLYSPGIRTESIQATGVGLDAWRVIVEALTK
jgi:hypothetical protein